MVCACVPHGRQATQRFGVLISEDGSVLIELQKEATRMTLESEKDIALSYAAGQLWGVVAELRGADAVVLADWGQVRC